MTCDMSNSSSANSSTLISEAAEAAAIAALTQGEHAQQGDVSLSRASAAAAWQIHKAAAAEEAAKSGLRPIFRRINLARMG